MIRRNVAVKGSVTNTGNLDWGFAVQLHINNPQETRYGLVDYTQTAPAGVLAAGASVPLKIDTEGRAPDGGWEMRTGWKLKIALYLLVKIDGKWELVDSLTFPDYVEP